jgi:cytochrome P450
VRWIGALFARWPALGGSFVVARRQAVQDVLRRPESFTNASHRPHLVAGDFLIGQESGPGYDRDRAIFKGVLDALAAGPLQGDADGEARSRAARFAAEPGRPFDLIEDYLMWVVLHPLLRGFGAAAPWLVSGSRGIEADEALALRYMHEVRHVAAHLFGGAEAPVEVLRRAEISAAALQERIGRVLPEIALSWTHAPTAPYAALRRNALGLTWVSHPVTVQAGALAMRELIGRPMEYAALRGRVHELGDAAWSDAELRTSIRKHVLELMRFRPVFPALARDVPRPAVCPSGARHEPQCQAGSSLVVLSLAAMFDAHDSPVAGGFNPQRDWGALDDVRWLMFGHGPRQCPAKSQAVAILESALLGLLTLPKLRFADGWGRRIEYDGPMVRRMRMRLD